MRHASCDAQTLPWNELGLHVERQRRQAHGELARFTCVLLAAALLIAGGLIVVPGFSYTVPHLEAGSYSPTTPEGTVSSLLNRTGWLPAHGTQAAQRGDRITWAEGGNDLPHPDQRVVRYRIQRVRVSSFAPLLLSALSRSPTCRAIVEAEVETADGQQVKLEFVVWQFRLLLPGAWNAGDNGAWMPDSVTWE